MAARVLFAGATQVVRVDDDAAKRALARDDDVVVDHRLILEREGVERTAQFRRRHHQRRREAVAMPRARRAGRARRDRRPRWW